MQIYTSYFGRTPFMKMNNIQPVAICRFLPQDFYGPVFQTLAPSAELLLEYKTGKYDWDWYKDKFNSELLSKNVAAICTGLLGIAEEYNTEKIALCCYELPEMNCHRHIVADFFNKFNILGGDVHELNGNDVIIESEALF